MKYVYKIIPLVVITILLFYANPNPTFAELPFFTDEIGDYLLIGNGPVTLADAVDTDNFEFGANKAMVPATSECGPGLAGNVPALPPNTLPVFSGISGDGNVAIIKVSPDGVFNIQDVGVFADKGIEVAAPTADAGDDGTSESYFNDPQYPNTFDGIADCTFFAGDPPMLIDDPNFAGVTAGVDFTALIAELYGPVGARAVIPSLVQTDTLDVSSGLGSGGQGVIQSTTVTINLVPGLNVIDVVTGGGVDFLLDNSNLVIDGPTNSFAIIRIPDDANFIISNGNVLVGDGGMGLNNVIFYSENAENNVHFNFDNTILNGVAFWTLEPEGEININNSQGCTQLVADKINLNDVRFTRCAPDDDRMVGGSGMAIDKTTLLVYGVETNSFWMIPAIVSAIGIGIGIYLVKRKL